MAINALGRDSITHRRLEFLQHLDMLPVVGLPQDIPNQIEVDVSAMEAGDNITIADLKLPEGITTDLEGERVVFTVSHPRIVEEETTEDEAAAEEGVAAEAEAVSEAASRKPEPINSTVLSGHPKGCFSEPVQGGMRYNTKRITKKNNIKERTTYGKYKLQNNEICLTGQRRGCILCALKDGGRDDEKDDEPASWPDAVAAAAAHPGEEGCWVAPVPDLRRWNLLTLRRR